MPSRSSPELQLQAHEEGQGGKGLGFSTESAGRRETAGGEVSAKGNAKKPFTSQMLSREGQPHPGFASLSRKINLDFEKGEQHAGIGSQATCLQTP